MMMMVMLSLFHLLACVVAMFRLFHYTFSFSSPYYPSMAVHFPHRLLLLLLLLPLLRLLHLLFSLLLSASSFGATKKKYSHSLLSLFVFSSVISFLPEHFSFLRNEITFSCVCRSLTFIRRVQLHSIRQCALCAFTIRFFFFSFVFCALPTSSLFAFYFSSA